MRTLSLRQRETSFLSPPIDYLSFIRLARSRVRAIDFPSPSEEFDARRIRESNVPVARRNSQESEKSRRYRSCSLRATTAGVKINRGHISGRFDSTRLFRPRGYNQRIFTLIVSASDPRRALTAFSISLSRHLPRARNALALSSFPSARCYYYYFTVGGITIPVHGGTLRAAATIFASRALIRCSLYYYVTHTHTRTHGTFIRTRIVV